MCNYSSRNCCENLVKEAAKFTLDYSVMNFYFCLFQEKLVACSVWHIKGRPF
jgi:hypothetical protein